MTTIRMNRLPSGQVKIYAAIPKLSCHELQSIGKSILAAPYITIGADNYECAVHRCYGCESYFRVSVCLDAQSSNTEQLCALLLFYKTLELFFTIDKIQVFGLVQYEPAYA